MPVTYSDSNMVDQLWLGDQNDHYEPKVWPLTYLDIDNLLQNK